MVSSFCAAGSIVPPPEVRELLAKEKAKFPPECWPPATEERILNQWTVGYYFDYLGHEVIEFTKSPRKTMCC